MDFKASDNQDQTGLMDDGLSLKLGTQLKNIVFSVMFTLLKDHEMNIYIAIMLCVIEFLQTISLIFYEIFETVWGSEDIFNVVSTGLSYTRLVTYVKDTNMTVYSAVFFILLAILVLLLAASVYVSYIYSKKKANFSWILNSFRYVVILITTILFLPVFEYFISFFHCVKDLDGQYVHAIFTEVQCWTGIHLADCVLAGVSAFILVLITIVTTSTYFEARNIPSSPNSRVTSRACVLFNAYKLLIVILLTFLTEDKYRILNIVIIMAGSVLIFYMLQFDNPFYNIVMAKVWSTSAAVNLWSATMLIFAKVMDSTSFSESIITWLLGIPMIVLLSIKIDDKRMDFLLINVNKFEKGKEIINQVTYLLKLLDSQHEDHNSAVLLDGYLEVHKQDCPDEDCPLKKKNKVITKNKIVRNLLSNDPNLNEKEAIIVYLVYQLYLRGLQKFDTDTTLRISYAFFLLDKMHSKHQALQELIEAEQKNPPPDEQFIIFRYKKIIEDDIADAQHEKQKDGLDLVNEIAFQSHFRMCQANIEKAALLHMEFWSQLSEDQPDLAKLADIGAKISLSIMSVEEHWGKLMKISPNNIKAMRLFGKFLIEVLHDIARGDELLDKAQSITNANAKKKNATNFITTGAGVDEGTPVIIISGEQDRFALITTINLAASSLFGFSKTELVDRKINTLMPPIYAKYHDSFIDAYLVKNENIATATSKEKLAFGKNKANYIFPFYYTIKAIPSIIQGIQFVATIRLEKNLKNTAYVLVNPDGAIDSISSSCISLLKIDVKHIIAKKTKIQDCVPNIIADKANLFHSNSTGGKSHTQVQFTYPKDSEYIDEEDEKSASLNCQMNDLTATNLKDGFGYLFKFEKGAERTTTLSAPIAQEARITNFQFKFSKNKANIIGEFAEGNEDIEDYYRRQTTNVHMSDFVNRANDNQDDDDYEEEDNKEQEIELQKKKNEEEEERSFQKIDYGIGIKTLRLMHGGIQEIEDDKSDDSSSKDENDQAASTKKSVQNTVEESQEEGSLSDFGNAEKSKKVLASVINDKTSPQNITNLKIIVAVAFLIMIGLSIFDYVNIAKKANDISTSVDNIDTSHQLIANIMIALSGVRDLYLLDNSAVTTTESVLKSKVQTALTTAKLLKETLESNQNDLSAAHLNLLNNAVIAIKNYDGSISYESLVQATEEVVTKGLNLITDDISLINPTNPDYIYLTTNLLNNYYIALETSAEYYTQGLIDKTAKGNISFILVLVFSILVLALSMLALIPIIYSVVKARDHVLTLFFDIPSQTVKVLYSQCESFVSDLQLGEDDEVAAEVDEEEVAKMNEEAETNEWMPRKKRRKFRNTSKNYRSFFLTYLAMICFLEWVFIYNYTTSNKLLSNVSAVTTEYNSTSYAEFFFSFTNNAERQYFIDQSFQILNQAPYSHVNKSIILMQNLDSGILEENSLNIGSHTDTYNTIFQEIIYQDSCPLLTSVVTYATCEAFADMTITKGMTIANVRHFENLRTLLKATAEILVNNTWPFDSSYLTPTLDSDDTVNMLLSLFRVPQALEAADMQDIYIKTNYRTLVEDFKTSLKDDSNNLTTLRLLMFLLFIFEAIIVYIFIWLPLVLRLNGQLLKTKGMLRMIPIGVLVKIKNIRAYLRNFLNENHLHNY